MERVVVRDFPPGQRADVLAALDGYGAESDERGRARVQLAVLKLAAGDFELLRTHLEVANMDYRDVLAAAEYPNYMRDIPPSDRAPEAERQRAIRSDWEQYQAWLRRE